MKKVLDFFKQNQPTEILKKNIDVFGFKKQYNYDLVGSVTKYLFEELNIIENIAPLKNTNRTSQIRPKKYITIHDTGAISSKETAEFWSEVVRTQNCDGYFYAASYQYVVGNDGIYHNIPDNEIAYHAGDGTKFDYNLIDTEVTGTNPNPTVTISEDGHYEIDGVKSEVPAPMAFEIELEEEIDDEKHIRKIKNHRLPKTSDINDQGILCKLINGKYYIGLTYFNTDYRKIANRGGNNNSIGIESCINKGSDIYWTWQRTAKLVACLLYNYNLTFDDIKQHHFFSGKNCPETMRENQLYAHVIKLIEMEYYVLKFKKEGYEIKLICDDERVLPNGRVKLSETDDSDIEFEIEVKKDGKSMRDKFRISVS